MLEQEREASWFLRGRILNDVATAGLVGSGELLDFGHEDGELVATAFGWQAWFPVDLEDGVEAACRLVMDQIQDGVIDRLGRPWPELLDVDGRFVGVLDVGEAAGIACWSLRGVAFCAVGQLSAAVPAAGLRLAQGVAR